MTGSLCAVHGKKRPVTVADGADFCDGLDRPADIAGVLYHDQTGLRGKELFKLRQAQNTGLIAGRNGNADARSLQLHGRTRHGVVLHAADDEMISGAQDPLHNHIQAHGDATGKNGIAGIAAAAE